MKNLLALLLCIMAAYTLNAQNGTVEAEQGVILGNNSGTTNGTIRYTGTDFEGRLGGIWESLTSSSLWTENASDIYFDTGNVGIGTDSPMGPLHVTGGDTYLDGELYVGGTNFVANGWTVAHFQNTNPGAGSGFYLHTDDAGYTGNDGAQISLASGADPDLDIANRENGGIAFKTDGYGTKMYLNAAGDFGVGTVSPTARLHVNGGDTYLEGELYAGAANPVGNTWSVAHFQNPAAGTGSAIFLQTADSGFSGSDGFQMSLGTGATPDVFFTNREGEGFGFFSTAINEIVTFDGSGNVGIGNTSPTGRLHVVGGDTYLMGGNVGIGTTAPSDHLVIMDTTDPVFTIGNDAFNEATSGKLYFDEDATAGGLCGIGFEHDGAANRLHLVGGCPGLDTLMSVTRGGSFMFGTQDIANGYMMSVAGKIMCEELRVELEADWPDYVFSDDYNLMSLANLEKFIQTNNHLPNIPSAEEVQDSGIEVGEMQKLMMEKIEELTLYILQQQKEIDALKAEVQSLSK